jgi:hypothetical protein
MTALPEPFRQRIIGMYREALDNRIVAINQISEAERVIGVGKKNLENADALIDHIRTMDGIDTDFLNSL